MIDSSEIDVNDNEEMQQKSRMKYINVLFFALGLFMTYPGVAIRRSSLDEDLSEDYFLQKIFF